MSFIILKFDFFPENMKSADHAVVVVGCCFVKNVLGGNSVDRA